MEMAGVLMLLATFSVLSLRLMNTSLATPRTVVTSERQGRVFDTMLEAMGRDVWNAEEVAVGDRYTVVLRHAEGMSTVWRVSPRKFEVERAVLKGIKQIDARVYRFEGATIEFEGLGSVVELRMSGGIVGRPVVRRFGSEVLRIGGGR
jgi:hypothetical protein